MNRIILALIILIFGITICPAQNLLSKIPAQASMVIKYSGENFSKAVQMKKIDSYGFVKEHLSKALKLDSLTSLGELGIDFEKDIYQYITMQDSATSFVSLFNLNDPAKFLKLLDANYKAEMKPEKKNTYEFLAISANTYVGWNNEKAVLVLSNYQNTERYPYYTSTTDSTVAAIHAPMADTAISLEPPGEEKIEEIIEAPIQKPKTVKKKPVAGKKKIIREPAKKAIPKKKPVEIIDEEIKVEDIPEKITEDSEADHNDSLEQAKRKAWDEEQERNTKAKQKLAAGNIIETSFNGVFTSIENDISYKKVIDPAAHMALWINSDNILNQYWSTFYGGFSPYRNYYKNNITNTSNDAYRTGVNVYFDKERMRIEQRSFSPDEAMSNLGKELFNSKQSAGLAGYINPDNIGYLSMSINTEAMAAYYYKLIKQYLNNTPYISEYSEVVDVYVDLLEIIIDEKALAELMPGNYMFVLHDMKTKQVSYSTYEYDEDFKYKEVKKTKMELSPDFTFVMESKKEGFMQKVLKLPLKYAKKEKFNYTEKDGYYEYVFDEGKYPLSSLYFMMKDGKLVVTTSKASIDMAIGNTGYSLDADTKNAVLNNNYSMKINSKKLIQELSGQMNTNLNKKICAWLEENMGDVKMETRYKDGMMQGNTIMNISGNHTNSLEFFFNMIDAINTIMENDKQEKEQKLN